MSAALQPIPVADRLAVSIAVGDPLPDVGRPPLFHSEAALVAVPGDLGLLFGSHRHCHVPSHTETSCANDSQVSRERAGE